MSEQDQTVDAATEASAQAPAEQATEVVDAAANIVAVVKRWPGFEDFGAGLQEGYRQAHGVVFDLQTVKGNQQARQLRQTLVRTRTAIKDRQKEEKAKLRKKIEEDLELVDDVAAKALEFVAALEDPLDASIRADEQRRKDEAEAKKRQELERIAALVQRIDDITSVAVRAVDQSSADIARKIELIDKLAIDESFEEKKDEAELAKKNTLARLNELHARALKLEQERAEAEATKARLEQLEREAAESRRQEAEAREARERQEAEQRAQREAQERASREAEQARQARQSAAQDAVAEIQPLSRSAVKLNAAALLEVIEKVRGLKATIDCGEYETAIKTERDSSVEYLTELHAQKVADEKRQEEAMAAQRAAEEKQRHQEQLLSEIEGFRQELFASQLEDTTPERVRRRIEELKRVTLDEQRWGILRGSAQAVLDATLTGLEQWLYQLENPPTPLERVQADERPVESAPILIGVDLAAGPDQTATGAVEFSEPVADTQPPGEAAGGSDGGYATITAEEAYEAEAEGLRLKQIENELLEHQALHALLSEVVNVAKVATRQEPGGPYLVPAADFQQLCEALTRVPLPSPGMRYAADGTLLNADGTRSIFCDVDG